VQVVGCLVHNESNDTWVVTSATEPVRATHPQGAADELQASTAKPLGSGTVELMTSASQNPASTTATKWMRADFSSGGRRATASTLPGSTRSHQTAAADAAVLVSLAILVLTAAVPLPAQQQHRYLYVAAPSDDDRQIALSVFSSSTSKARIAW
jgi:hypothetical protein